MLQIRQAGIARVHVPLPSPVGLGDPHGVIELERNNHWVTPWNPTLSSVLRSNHDINFVPTLIMAFSAVYYIYDHYEQSLLSCLQTKAPQQSAVSPRPGKDRSRPLRLHVCALHFSHASSSSGKTVSLTV